MKQSESIDLLAPALVAAQAEIGGAVKGAENPFFKSKYADLNSVILAMKPIFVKNGFALIQMPVSDNNGVGVSTRILHESGQWLEEYFTLPMAKNDPQQAGSAITYAKRYSLKALGLMPDLDDDGEAAMFRQVDSFTDEQKTQFFDMIGRDDGFALKDFHANFGDEVMADLFNVSPHGTKTKVKTKVRDAVSKANTALTDGIAALQALADSDAPSDQIHEALSEMEPRERVWVINGLDLVLKQQIESVIGEFE